MEEGCELLEFPGAGKIVEFKVHCLQLRRECPDYVLYLLAQYQNTLIDAVCFFFVIYFFLYDILIFIESQSG